MRYPLLVGLAATLALASCGDSPATADAGYKAFLAGDYTNALFTFNTVLARVEKVGPDHKPAALDRLQALAHVDAEQSKIEFLALLEAGMPMDARDFSLIATELFSAHEACQALALIDGGHQALPENKLIEKLLEIATARALSYPLEERHTAGCIWLTDLSTSIYCF